MTIFKSSVIGCGAHLPEKAITNAAISTLFDTTDEWITTRVGVKQRYWASENETTSDLGAQAAIKALKSANIDPLGLDLIIVATTTPDTTLPSTATHIQRKIGAYNAFAFDVQAVCTGFIYALSVADQFIKTGHIKTALVIGAETLSRILDPKDRATSVIFGDGAGAIVLKSVPSSESRGVLLTNLYSDGRYADLLFTDGGAGSNKQVGHLRMQGKDVMKLAINKIGEAVEKALETLNLSANDIDWFVPHQANLRIIEGISRRFNIPMEKTVVTIDKHGNTSAASIPLALYEATSDGRIKPGDLVMLESMGGGFTWGVSLIRW